MRNPLPKIEALPGTVHKQRVKCGKAGCKCRRGALHAAFYRFWREGGKVRKAYVRQADVEATREACRLWQEAERSIRELVNGPEGDRVRAQARATLREALGEQINTPGGQKALRRLRSKRPGERPDNTLERLAGMFAGVELKVFRF